jgi:hypothetical protein
VAAVEILDQSDAGGGAQYITVRVAFPDHEFVQLLISAQVGEELTTQLQAYADEYEAAWLALPPQPEEQNESLV